MGVVIMLEVGGGSNLIVLLSIRSWILFFNAQQSLVSCPGLFERKAHFALGLYFREAVLGLEGGVS